MFCEPRSVGFQLLAGVPHDSLLFHRQCFIYLLHSCISWSRGLFVLPEQKHTCTHESVSGNALGFVTLIPGQAASTAVAESDGRLLDGVAVRFFEGCCWLGDRHWF